MTDPSLYRAQRLKEALAADPRVGELGLDVDEAAGKIHVRGVVSSEDQRSAIDAVAVDVLGEVAIVNETLVKQINDPLDEESIA